MGVREQSQCYLHFFQDEMRSVFILYLTVKVDYVTVAIISKAIAVFSRRDFKALLTIASTINSSLSWYSFSHTAHFFVRQ